MEIISDKGWNETIIKGNCDYDTFYNIAEILSKIIKVVFTKKFNDFDSLYWDFLYQDQKLTLHYNIYLGVSVFPTDLEVATKEANLKILELSKQLLKHSNI